MTRESDVSDVVTLGEALVAFLASERGPMAEAIAWTRTITGAEANVAVGLARLGVDVAFIGRVGEDGLGRAIVRRLRGEGVDVEHLRADDAAPTGVLFRELRDLGPAEVVYWRRGSAGARLEPGDVEAAADRFEGCRWLHVSGITPGLSASAAAAVDAAAELAHQAGATVSLDLNLRRRLWSEQEAATVLSALAPRCDVVLGSLDEVAVVAGLAAGPEAGAHSDPEDAADAMLALGPRMVVVKLGADGALARTQGDGKAASVHAASMAISVVDPVGAGDAFCAGFIAATLQGADAAQVLRVANACGASVAATIGDIAGLPTRAELSRLLMDGGLDTLR